MGTGDVLQQIQKLQYEDKNRAEILLRQFISTTLNLDVQSVELRPLAVSLNSFNGFLVTGDGRRLFFKTHIEADNVISEYYNATVLAEAGYPVIRPVFASTQAGQQLLIYEIVESPSVFDVAWEIETGEQHGFTTLAEAQLQSDKHLSEIYWHTLRWHSALEAAQAPVHQLFHHRLAQGRLERFYGPLPGQGAGMEHVIMLPDGEHHLSAVRSLRWEINGQRYSTTLDDLISDSLRLLIPDQDGPSIIGHGDAHNGNVFFEQATRRLIYFDPAFAGRHNPLLDLAKPLFHNVFAMWMYFPQQKAAQVQMKMRIVHSTCIIEHNYAIHPVRQMFLKSKVENVLLPLLLELRRRQWLRADWRHYLKAALFCCPFLTMNLADHSRFPPKISLLGLTMAVEMGGESEGQRSLIDEVLDQVEHEIGPGHS